MVDNLPATALSGDISQLSALPQDMLAAFSGMSDDIFAGTSGGVLRTIKVRTTDFYLNDGGDGESVPFNSLYVLLLGASPVNHAVWYRKAFNSNNAGERPDLVWKMPDMETFPDALPEQFRQKVDVGGRKAWAFSIRRRTVWAIVRPNQQGGPTIDWDNPYIFDIPSSSVFGTSAPERNEYRWNGLASLCAKYSTQGVRVFPGMFIMQIVPDANGTRGTVLFKPMCNQQGALQFLSNDLIARMFSVAQSPAVRSLCDVREKLTLDDAASSPSQPVMQAQPAPQPAPAPQPVAQPAMVQQPAPTPTPAAAPAAPAQPVDTQALLQQAAAVQAQYAQPSTSAVETPPPANASAVDALLARTHNELQGASAASAAQQTASDNLANLINQFKQN